ncbi:sigma-70 family RNA polymerase sigma factor [Alienimonas chondri]|uniref:RNA polymerase sigma factor RpoD n=1 Tax=Alienimonas chondri TaxID=2681879 RepID=A0ABX1VBC1_9PLAN|nr:sigma-70 family RNA polymerase sigma factor [Alienimonas chondri]NNJ25177.1 RNA polymerase sigma factor RpoD [Alienimonas chondri]
MSYSIPDLKNLTADDIDGTPREVQLARVRRAERLAGRLDPDAAYAATDLRRSLDGAGGDVPAAAEADGEATFRGEDALRDLRLFAEDLSTSVGLSAEEVGEPVLTVDEIARKLGVSGKTVDRWRDRGLVSRKLKLDGRRRVGFLQSTVDRFVRDHADVIEQGRKSVSLSDADRGRIVRKARSLANSGFTPPKIAEQLSEEFGRSPESIRTLLREFERANPDRPVFRVRPGDLTRAEKEEILRRRRRGVTLARLAKTFGRTKPIIKRALHELRAEEVMGDPPAYMDSPEFHTPDADEVILCEPPVKEKPHRRIRVPSGLPPYLASLYNYPLLTREDEQYWFRKMNYLKFKAATLREEIGESDPTEEQLDRLEAWTREAIDVKNFLTQSNLRLVVSIGKRHIKPGANFFSLVSDGNVSLMRAIEKFDYTKGNKFSTYATWAIMKNFARSIPQEHRQLDRFRTGKEEVFQFSKEDRANPYMDELTNNRQRKVIGDILMELDDRERDILRYRYGLEQGSEPQTLEQVGNRFGVTKERIRQLEGRALRKLKKHAEGARLEVPGLHDR